MRLRRRLGSRVRRQGEAERSDRIERRPRLAMRGPATPLDHTAERPIVGKVVAGVPNVARLAPRRRSPHGGDYSACAARSNGSLAEVPVEPWTYFWLCGSSSRTRTRASRISSAHIGTRRRAHHPRPGHRRLSINHRVHGQTAPAAYQHWGDGRFPLLARCQESNAPPYSDGRTPKGERTWLQSASNSSTSRSSWTTRPLA